MKISDASGRPISRVSQGNGPVENNAVPAKPSQQPDSDDSIQLSNLTGQLATNSPGRLAKLAQVGAAVLSGQYHVDANVVSASIIQHALQMSVS